MKNSSSDMIDSIISHGSEFKGEFSLIGNLKLDGVFRGRIISDGNVIIGSKGIGVCDVIAREVVVGGEFRGSIVAVNRVKVLRSGSVKGNIFTSSLLMEDGVQFNGYCKVDSTMFDNLSINIEELSRMRILRDENSRLIIDRVQIPSE